MSIETTPSEESRVNVINGQIQHKEMDYTYHCARCGRGFESPFNVRMHQQRCSGDPGRDNYQTPRRVRKHSVEQRRILHTDSK